jgi:hypothetical protein
MTSYAEQIATDLHWQRPPFDLPHVDAGSQALDWMARRLGFASTFYTVTNTLRGGVDVAPVHEGNTLPIPAATAFAVVRVDRDTKTPLEHHPRGLLTTEQFDQRVADMTDERYAGPSAHTIVDGGTQPELIGRSVHYGWDSMSGLQLLALGSEHIHRRTPAPRGVEVIRPLRVGPPYLYGSTLLRVSRASIIVESGRGVTWRKWTTRSILDALPNPRLEPGTAGA